MLNGDIVKATATLTYGDGTTKEIEIEGKETYDLEDCDEGKVVILFGYGDDQITGIFRGTSDDGENEDVILSTLDDDKVRLAFNMNAIAFYFEEIK
jgi:hypothetical protein